MSKIEQELSPEVQEHWQNSPMSKAGRLAMELNAERKRLKQEMEELRREFKDTQLPDPEMYPQSFLYCVKVLRTLKELKYGSIS